MYFIGYLNPDRTGRTENDFPWLQEAYDEAEVEYNLSKAKDCGWKNVVVANLNDEEFELLDYMRAHNPITWAMLYVFRDWHYDVINPCIDFECDMDAIDFKTILSGMFDPMRNWDCDFKTNTDFAHGLREGVVGGFEALLQLCNVYWSDVEDE